jgi:hypothetical protein
MKPVRVQLFTTRVSYNHICRGGPTFWLMMKQQVPHAGMCNPVELSSAGTGRRCASRFFWVLPWKPSLPGPSRLQRGWMRPVSGFARLPSPLFPHRSLN